MIFPDHEFVVVVVVVVVDTSQRVERLTRPSLGGQSFLGGRCGVLCWVDVLAPLICHGPADSLLTSLVRVRSVWPRLARVSLSLSLSPLLAVATLKHKHCHQHRNIIYHWKCTHFPYQNHLSFNASITTTDLLLVSSLLGHPPPLGDLSGHHPRPDPLPHRGVTGEGDRSLLERLPLSLATVRRVNVLRGHWGSHLLILLSHLCSGADGVRSTDLTCLRLGMTGRGVRLSYSSLVIVTSRARGDLTW